MTGLMEMVARGLGFAVLPYSAASLARHSHPVLICEICGFYTWRTLVRRSDRELSPAGQKAWNVIMTEIWVLNATGVFGPPSRVSSHPMPHCRFLFRLTALCRRPPHRLGYSTPGPRG